MISANFLALFFRKVLSSFIVLGSIAFTDCSSRPSRLFTSGAVLGVWLFCLLASPSYIWLEQGGVHYRKWKQIFTLEKHYWKNFRLFPCFVNFKLLLGFLCFNEKVSSVVITDIIIASVGAVQVSWSQWLCRTQLNSTYKYKRQCTR